MSFLLLIGQSSRLRAVLFALLPFATGCVRCLGAQCTEGLQTPRVLEAADGRPAYVESPIAMPTKGGVLLLGVPALVWAERDAFDPPPSTTGLDTAAYLARLHENHDLIGFLLGRDNTATPVRPAFAGPARRLVAISGTDGTIHVAWFSPPRGSSDPDVDGAVWYAERRGNQWTVPVMVFSADRLDWSGQKAVLLIRHTSDVHLVVPYYRGQVAGIAYIRRVNGRWRTTETALRGMPSQAAAQFVGADSLAVAFAGVGAAGVRVRNGQHVYLIRAALSDTVWPSATLVHWSGLDAVRWLAMYKVPLTAGSQGLALMWNRIPRDSRAAAATLYAIVSENGGVTWYSPQILRLPFRVGALTQDRDTWGNVHVVVTSSGRSDPDNTQMYHAALRKGRWTNVDSVLTGPVASGPTLSTIGRDTLLLVWGNARPAGRGLAAVIAPVSKYAPFVSACPRGIRK
jgi:hypothetical protein